MNIRASAAIFAILVGLGMIGLWAMLLYTVVQSSGYYIQLGQSGIVGMFAVLAVLGLFFVRACLQGRLAGK